MPDALHHLIRTLSRLPGIGRRSAERIAYKLLIQNQEILRELRDALDRAEREITMCSTCGNLTEVDRDPCRLCTDPERSSKVICVVEAAPDIQILEQAGTYPGRYFCLGVRFPP